MAQQQSMINRRDAFFLSTIGNDTLHSTIKTQEIDADLARFSTVFVSDTLNASTVKAQFADISSSVISSLRGNHASLSTLHLLSDLSGGVGRVRFTADASGVVVSGDPLIFNNVVFLTSSINVVQVSTIVDASIIAQSGFFSTLSSGVVTAGSITASSIGANAGFFSTLNVSSITTTDISGFEPSDWSLYPTLNSSITFQPGNVLSNIGTKLFFAGLELTDLSGGGQNWSQFPALRDVSMNNFSLRQLSTLQYQDGATLVSQTGNNLLYNGQAITTGTAGNTANWASFPARTNITAGQSTLTVGNIQNNGSNITNGNTFTNSLGVGGLSLVPIASITSGGDLTCRNIEVGDSVTSLADVNIYGATALPGDSALFVEGGVQFSGGLIHGFSAGVIPVAGINSGRIDMLQAGFNILHPLVGAITTGGALALTAGGAISLAGGAFIETNTSTIKMTNSSQGNKQTTLQAGFLTIDPSVATTNSIKLFNTLGGGVEIDGGGQGSLQGFSTVQSQFISSISTSSGSVRGIDAVFSSVAFNYALGISTQVQNIRATTMNLIQDLTGISAGGPVTARILGLSTINSFNVSTTDLYCSSINGQAIGGGGGGASTISSFVTLQTSSFKVSTLSGTIGGVFTGSTCFVEGGFQFVGEASSGPGGSRFLSSVRGILSPGQRISIEAQELDIIVGGGGSEVVRIGTGGAFDTKIREYDNEGAVSTSFLLVKAIVPPTTGLDISGSVFLDGTLELPEAGGGINFDFGSPGNFSRFERRDVANNNMVALTNNTGLSSNNMVKLGVGELWITGGADQEQAVRLYSQFPYGNYELDAIDENGTTLFAYMQGFENGFGINPGFLQAYSNVSSISGYNQNSLTDPQLNVIGGITTQSLTVSTINGLPVGGSGVSTFQTLGTSSFTFSTATSVGSNTLFNRPILIDYDHAGATSNSAGVAIAVQGHNFGSGAVINRIEIGARASGENYIASFWPGQNLEDLSIEATATTFNDGVFSTIISQSPFSLLTDQGIVQAPLVSTAEISVSSINGFPFPTAVVFAEFLTTASIQVSGANTPTNIALDTLGPNNLVNLDASDCEVTISGLYEYSYNIQLDKSGGGSSYADIWLRLNGNDIANTGSRVSVQGNAGQTLAVCSFVLFLSAGDKIGLVFASPDSTMTATAFPAQVTPGDPYDCPAIPANISFCKLIV